MFSKEMLHGKHITFFTKSCGILSLLPFVKKQFLLNYLSLVLYRIHVLAILCQIE
jgi:hypothetical protein